MFPGSKFLKNFTSTVFSSKTISFKGNAEKNRAKLAATVKNETNLNFQFVTRNERIFKDFGVSLSKYGRIFEIFDKIDFRTLADEKERNKFKRMSIFDTLFMATVWF